MLYFLGYFTPTRIFLFTYSVGEEPFLQYIIKVRYYGKFSVKFSDKSLFSTLFCTALNGCSCALAPRVNGLQLSLLVTL